MGLLLLAAAAVSGTAALVAEVVWFRALGRGVGTSAEALAVVSASFLGGLGLGAAIASRLSRRVRTPLRAAAVCEVLAGLLVVASPWALARVPDAHLAVLHALGMEPGPSAWPAALVALPVMAIPTTFLGATLPFLVRSRVVDVRRAGRWTGWLYGANTLGAATGVLVAVAALLPSLGEIASLRYAGCGNLVAALLLLVADFAVRPSAEAAPAAARPEPPPLDPALRRRARLARAALFGSGVVALGGEVAWLRLLEPMAGTHLYGFAVLLAAVLVGTALGGLVGGAVADRVRRPDLALATALTIAGVLSIASVAAAGNVPWMSMAAGTRAASRLVDAKAAISAAMGDASTVADHVGRAVLAARLLGCALVVIPPLAALASAYPLAVRAASNDPASAAAASGSVYAWNTAGNVVGSLVAGFLLLPRLGGAGTLEGLGGLACLGAGAAWLASPRPRAPWPAVALALPALALSIPSIESVVARSAPTLPEIVALDRWTRGYRVASRADARALAESIAGTFRAPLRNPSGPVVRPRDGVVSTVGILQEGDTPKLRQGALSESKFDPDDPDAGSETEVALALVPYLLHEAPRRALVIGHGAGWTAETMIAGEDLRRVDVAEIEPAVLDVVEAMRGPLAVRRGGDRVRLRVADGRLLLREAARGERYDLVVSQPSHPWVPGAGHLFTREAYALARDALAPGGIFAQWLNLFDMSTDLFRSAIASWISVFPDSWLLEFGDEVVLVGFTSPPRIDPARWERVLAGGTAIGARARAAGIVGPERVLGRWLLDGPKLASIVPPGQPLATDDDARLELGLARRRLERPRSETDAIHELLHGAFPPDVAKALPDAATREAWIPRVVVALVESGHAPIARLWDESVRFDGGADGLYARGVEALASARARAKGATMERAEDLLHAAASRSPEPRPTLAYVDLLVSLDGRQDDAVKAAQEAVRRFPEDGRVLARLGRAYARAEKADLASDAYRRALAATKPAAPAGTGLEWARRLLAAEPPRSKEARAALETDRTTRDDRDALEEYHRLTIELSAGGEGASGDELDRLAARRDALDRVYAQARLRAATYELDRDATAGLDAAREATALLPRDARAWEVRGWLELRTKAYDAAVESLRRAASLATGREDERRAVYRSWMRIFGRDPASLDAAP